MATDQRVTAGRDAGQQLSHIEPILLRVEVGDGVERVAHASIDKGVRPGAAGQQVSAFAAGDDVIARRTGQRVATGATVDRAQQVQPDEDRVVVG